MAKLLSPSPFGDASEKLALLAKPLIDLSGNREPNYSWAEGYLADSFRFLQAVLLRKPTFRARYYRPLAQRP